MGRLRYFALGNVEQHLVEYLENRQRSQAFARNCAIGIEERAPRNVLDRRFVGGTAGEALGVRAELIVERFEIAYGPMTPRDGDDEPLFSREPKLLVLKRSHFCIVRIEARNVLLRLLRGNAEQER